MAKSKRTTVGTVVKSKDPTKSNYLKFYLKNTGGSLTVTDGQILSVESKKYQLDSLNSAVSSGKLSEELAAKIRERIEKIPDYVLGEIVLVEKN
jgi:hypothetical protein